MTETIKKTAEPSRNSVAVTGVYGRRRRHVIRLAALAAAIVAAFAAAAVGYSSLQPRVYGAQADLLITPRPDISDTAAERAMVTQVMVISSDPVLRPVAGRFNMSVTRLRDKVSAEIVGRSNLLRLTVGDADQSRAVELVRLITAEYLVRTTPAPTTPADADQEQPPTRSTVLSAAAALEKPLQPQPIRALAAGVLLGLLAATVVVVVLVRPRWLTRPMAYWK